MTRWMGAFPLPAAPLPRRRGPVALRAAMLVGLAVILVSYVGDLRGRGRITWLDVGVYSGVLLAAAALCVARGLADRAERTPWMLLGAGMASYAAGNAYYTLVLADRAGVTYPNASDALYLAFYPLAYASLVGLIRARAGRLVARSVLDGLIVGLALAAVVAAAVLPAIVRSTGGSTASVATTLAYPLGDLGLLVLIAGAAAAAGWRPGADLRLMAAGLTTFAACDTVYVSAVANGSYHIGSALNAGWPVGMAAMGLAAWRGSAAHSTAAIRAAPTLPAGAAMIALGVLLSNQVRATGVTASALAAACIGLIVVRLLLSVREQAALAASRQEARTDPVTGLANRRAYTEALDTAFAGSQRDSVAVLLIDLDGFKELNDTLGHPVGDLLLARVGERMGSTLRAGDLLARLGGDEFGVLLGSGTGLDEAEAIAQRIRSSLQAPFVLEAIPVHVDASIGVAAHPEHADDAVALLRRVDVAMYDAKRRRLGVAIYAPSRDVHSRDRLELLGELGHGLEHDQLVLHLQPKVALADGRVEGLEALVRWQHPQRGLLYPDHFIGAVEQTNLLEPLTAHVVRAALQACVTLPADVGVAVNVSSASLADDRLRSVVATALASTGVAGRRLTVEVTESAVMQDLPRAIRVLESLRAMGVRIAIDDYGTGHSCLAHLDRLPVDELKIDRSFVATLADDRRRAHIVASTVTLAQDLGLRVVAEGVEDEASWTALRSMGCDLAQGYLIARPAGLGDVEAWLARWTAERPAWAVQTMALRTA